MPIKVPKSNIPDYFERFSKIKYLRSLLREFSYNPGAELWKSEDERVHAFSFKGIGYLDADIGSEQIIDVIENLPNTCYLIVNHDETNPNWNQILSKRWSNVKQIKRWAFSSENLKKSYIENNQNSLPDGFTLKRLGDEDYKYLDEEMSSIALLTYGNTEKFFDRATSFGIIDEREQVLVSMCTGYPMLKGKNEIDIRTRDDDKYRRKGFGSMVARALMIYSLENGITPEWDAANEMSRNMALKLGFSNPIKYLVYLCQNE